MLQIAFNDISVLAMRAEAPVKTFGSEDVPHGRNSVIVKACEVARSNGLAFPKPPQFEQAEIDAFVSAKKDTLEVLPLFDEEGNPINYDLQRPTEMQILDVSESEAEAEFYEDVNADPKVPKQHMDMNDRFVQLYPDVAAAKTALLDSRKQERASFLIGRAIEDCLLVPDLSEEFKAQFTFIEAE